MAFGVFVHRTDSIYDDVPSEQYQFPKSYLTRAEKCEGDWILYYEPTKVAETRGYFAVAHVQEIIPDPIQKDMYRAIITPNSYLDFGDPVSFRGETNELRETGLLNEVGKLSGRAQSAVRTISKRDFSQIIELGLGKDDELPRYDEFTSLTELNENQAAFEHDNSRKRIDQLISRAVRDRNFRTNVVRAYNKTCAVTGLRLINGKGRAEVEAAHILPVEENGPDIVRNGLALSGTVHWMFDRGVISIDRNFNILVSRHSNDPDAVHNLINSSGRLLLPKRRCDVPHDKFLAWHRENRFKH